MKRLKSVGFRGLLVAVFAILVCLVAVWQADAVNPTKVPKPKKVSLKGLVADSHQRPLIGATVYFIDSTTVNTTPITPPDILSGVAEAYDEPLEDIVNNPALLKSLNVKQATTGKLGKFSVKGLINTTRYYAFVALAATDTDHLPGGSASRIAFEPNGIPRTGLQITMSWNTPVGATYIGSSACYLCHGSGSKLDVSSNKHHGHSLMFRNPAGDTANQDSASHIGSSWNDLVNKFTVATQAPGAAPVPVAPATSVETLYFMEYDANQSNKWVIYENTKGTNVDPTIGKAGIVWFTVYLWKTAANQYNVTIQNNINPADPNNFETFAVPLTMGGYIRQRLLLSVPGLKGLYSFLTYQTLSGSASQGIQTNYDRTRKPFAEGGSGGGGFNSFITIPKAPNQQKATLNAVSTFAPAVNPSTGALTGGVSTVNSCAVCHIGAGEMSTFVAPTNETLAHTVSDPNGVYDLGGDGSLQEMGVNCEQCHGPGSVHRQENLNTITAPTPPPVKGKKTIVPDTTGKHIVNPQYLGNDRSSLICGACHHPNGFLRDDLATFPPPGISRAQFLANYANPAQKGTTLANLWPNQMEEKGGHHGMTYSNFLQSSHYRNARQLLACDDCHDSMGDSPYRYFLKGDPDDSSSAASLCLQCHALDVTMHVTQKTGTPMSGESMKCIQCHMTRTGKGGAGRPGLLLGTPTGLSSDANITYWENDQSAHTWFVPRKFDPGVAGITPPGGTPTSTPPAVREAMPIPYTNSCGTCHDPSKLQFQAAGPPTSAPAP